MVNASTFDLESGGYIFAVRSCAFIFTISEAFLPDSLAGDLSSIQQHASAPSELANFQEIGLPLVSEVTNNLPFFTRFKQ